MSRCGIDANMSLQNRVTPFGEIVENPARGLLMGNRGGRIHDADTKTLTKRRWASKRWIICVTQFRGRHRQIMAPNSYTELFFLDEVTALAAGHRPCFECQREKAKALAAAYTAAHDHAPMDADAMDICLHGERLACSTQSSTLIHEQMKALPIGAMFAQGKRCFCVAPDGNRQWHIEGYGQTGASSALQYSANNNTYRLLTPPSVITALRAGYQPLFHPTALT